MLVTRRCLILLGLGALPLAASGAVPGLGALALLWDLSLAIAIAADYLFCPRPDTALQATRETDEVLSVAVENPVRLRVVNASPYRLRVEVRDEPPGAFRRDGSWRAAFRLAPGQSTELEYTVLPPARGDFDFGDVEARVEGRLGLVRRQGTLPAAHPIAVYPDVRAVADYELRRARTPRTRAGARRIRLPGVGHEFASLRDYTADDEFRTIDWKATARRGQLTARVFEAERTRDVLLLIDQGRLMRQEIGFAQKLDHVLSAALLLAHAVAQADDRVGLLTFADAVTGWLTPRRGRAQAGAILQSLYALRARTVESDYRTAFRYLAARWRKRSLVVLFTDVADPDASAMLLQEIAHLAASHLVVCVTVRDPLLSAAARQDPERIEQVYEQAAAAEALDDRRRALALLARRGVLLVDAEPETLSAELVDRYLSVKQQALL